MSYLEYRRNLKLGAKPSAKKKDDKKELAIHYENLAAIAPSGCEECGKSLGYTISFHSRAHCCHIIEKSKINGCPSVATNQNNNWYGCLDCHTGYDKAIAEKDYESVQQMKIFPTLKERVKLFYHLIPETERRRVPEILRP